MDIKKNIYSKMYKEYKRFIFLNWKLLLERVETYNYSRSEKIYFWVTPWMGTNLPWYTISLAQIYAYIYKQQVTLIINDMFYESVLCPYNKDLEIILNKTIKILRLDSKIEVKYLSMFVDEVFSTEDQDLLESAAYINSIRRNESSEKNIKFYKMCKQWSIELKPLCKKINSFVNQNRLGYIFFPGGTFAETWYLYKKCMNAKMQFCTFDSGMNGLMIGINSIAAQYRFNNYYQYFVKSFKKDFLIQESKKILDARLHANLDLIKSLYTYGDSIIIQNEKYQSNAINFDIVICPNYEADSSALGTHDVFADDYEWLMETVQYILENTSYSVAVREHPLIRMYCKKTLKGYLKKFEISERFKLYTFRDKLNTYSIISNAKIVIVNTSTVGIEAAMLGKNVLTESNAYYSETPFVFKAKSKKEYFEYIDNLAQICKGQTEKAKNCACLYYGLAQLCNVAETMFSPDIDNYKIWSRKKIKDILNDGDTKLIFKAINKKVPITLLKFNKRSCK